MKATAERFSSLVLPAQAAVALAAFGSVFLFDLPGVMRLAAVTHLIMAVGIMPLIFGAMLYFVPVLTRSRGAPVVVSLIPLLALVAGGTVFAAFNGGTEAPYYFVVAAALGFAAALGLGLWMGWRAADCLGPPHPCLYWYLAAIGCLGVALIAVLLLHHWPGQYLVVKRFHLHLNTLGFIGLTAIGTLHVLMPTVTGRPDPAVATRLKRGLPVMSAGVLLAAAGAAWAKPLAWAGWLLWTIAPLALGAAWLRLYRGEIFNWHGAAPNLFAAVIGCLQVLVFGALHAGGMASGHDAMLSFVLGFLFPLVTGAVSHLLPVWIRPGRQTPWHAQARARLGRFNAASAILFCAGGAVMWFNTLWGLALALAGLAWFLAKLPWALRGAT